LFSLSSLRYARGFASKTRPKKSTKEETESGLLSLSLRTGQRHELPNELTPDSVRAMVNHFKKGGLLTNKCASDLLSTAIEMFKPLPAVARLQSSAKAPITVVGDVHGQFADVLKIFEMNGYPSPTNRYLFSGDIVDRGKWGCEILFMLFAYKL
jgi:serine/threonine-protein phosphatase 5